MAAKDNLERRRTQNTGAVGVTMTPPPVRINVPKINVPEIKVPALTADMTPIAEAIGQLAQVIQQIAVTQTEIIKALQQVAEQAPPEITVSAPEIKMPTKPRQYDVAFVEDDNGIVGMSIRANLPN